MPRLSTTLASFNKIKTAQVNRAGVFAARVKFSMIDDKTQSQVFKDFGEWSSIGCIFFDRLNQPNSNPQFTSDNFAKPLFPNNSNIPLHNEIVYVLALPNSSVQSDVNNLSYYYFQSINIWNSTHHNAIPDPIYGDANPESQQADYQQTEAGSVRRVTDGGTEIDLGTDFQEKLEIRNLQPYAGDLIYQGRWGQTIRFGSTIQGAQIPNPWSKSGNDGDPITILKNGQHEDDAEPWVPQVEDINTDLSSIYLTSTQEIPIELASDNYKSYDSSPEAAPKFTGEQVIINSGRLLFNSKTDNILLSSFDTINLNSVNSLNVDTPKTVVASKEIYLGDKNATEPVILGDKFLDDFKSLCSNIVQLCTALSVPIAEYPPTKAVAPLPIKAGTLRNQAQTMISSIEKYKSKVSKSK